MSDPEFAARDGAALVTGGSGAVGAAVTRMLAERGCRVVFTYRSNAAVAQELVAATRALGADVEARQLDLLDERATVGLVEEVEGAYGGIHTVVCASGPFVHFDYLSGITPQQFRTQVEAEAFAFFNLVHPCVGPLRRARGSLVAATTVALSRAIVRDGLSAGPKGAIEGIVRTFALEEGRFGVRANCVGVGITDVGMAADLIESGDFGERGQAEAMSRIPLRRFGAAEEMAEAICFLASDRARYITGQTLNVDGGYSV